MSKFKDMQQQVINDDLRKMSAETVNEILSDMKASEANSFLERLGHVRAADIYEQQEDNNESL